MSWAFVISKVPLAWPTALIKLYKFQHIFCHEAPYWPRTIAGDNDGLFRTEQKVSGMKILFLLLIKSPGHSRYFLCDHAITDRIGNPQFINRFSRFLNWVDRSRNDLDLFSFEFLL